jgi:hypothetical protein
MDAEKFDALIKGLSQTRLTRVSALRSFVAGLATAVTGLGLSAVDSEAKKKRKGKRGKKRKAKKNKKQRGSTGSPCGCSEDLSPKQCPVHSGIEYTCKLCPGISKGSVQVACDGDQPSCVCQKTGQGKGAGCVVNGQHFNPGEPVDVCSPERCGTDTCEPENDCQTNCTCNPDTGKCECDEVACHPENECEENCVCNPNKGCKCQAKVCQPENPCQTNCICNPKTGDCECETKVCVDKDGCTGTCNPDNGRCYYDCPPK